MGAPPKGPGLELINLLSFAIVMFANGTAVEGVCATRRNPPVDCPGCEHGIVPVGRRVWRGTVSYTHLTLPTNREV